MKLKKYILTLLTLTLASALFAAHPADKNKDKRVTWDEFSKFKKEQASKNGKPYDEQQIKYLFEDKDHDGDGVLSYEEFNRHAVDTDGDKSISYEEFVVMHKKRGERSGKAPKEEWVKNLFAKKDTNGDGALTYEELAAPVK